MSALVIILLVAGFFLYEKPRVDKIQVRKEGVNIRRTLEEYAAKHDEGIYIYDTSVARYGFDPVLVLPKDKIPNNLLFWGGACYNSPTYYEQLYSNGFGTIYSKDFFKKNVYFCGKAIPDDFLKYMQSNYPGFSIIIVDQINDLVVYQFTMG